MKNRRRAIKCELVEPSKSNPGYFKYVITIKELDGRIHDVPAYGVDMQDAIKKLIRGETIKTVKKVYDRKIVPVLMTLLIVSWLGSVVISSATGDYRYAYYGVIGMFSIATVYAIFKIVKGE